MLSKEKIKESFSRSASTYDEAADFQKETGHRLIQKILSDNVPIDRILDVGLGTGYITRELARIFSDVHGCDIAWGMASFSKRKANTFSIIQADAEALPYKPGTFGIVFSNITYQWIHNFRNAFLEVRRVLKDKGRFYFSILTDGSLKELYETLREVAGRGYPQDFLPGAKYINLELKWRDLDIIWWEELTIRRYYENCLELLRKFKGLGAGRLSGSNIFNMGDRELFFKMTDVYDKNFAESGKVFATYKVILGCVEKT